jgi:hypothetical protein
MRALAPSRHEVAFPDVLAPAARGAAWLTYLAGASCAACVTTDTPAGGRVIVVGFPLESLDDPAAGAALVALLGPRARRTAAPNVTRRAS